MEQANKYRVDRFLIFYMSRLILFILAITCYYMGSAQVIKPADIIQKQRLVGVVKTNQTPLPANNPQRVQERIQQLVCIPGTCTVLPLQLLEFEGKVKQISNLLEWKTTAEDGLLHFLVQRSANARDFDSIGIVHPQNVVGLHKYSLHDNHPLTGVSYYRLKMVNKDGSFEFSKVIRFFRPDFQLLRLYPNPAVTMTRLLFKSSGNIMYTWQLQDITGKVLRTQTFTSVNGNNTVLIPLNDLASGAYLITIIGNENKSLHQAKLQVIR